MTNPRIHVGKYEAEKKRISRNSWHVKCEIRDLASSRWKENTKTWGCYLTFTHVLCCVCTASTCTYSTEMTHRGDFLSRWPLFNNEHSVFKLWNTTSRIYAANDMPVSWVNLKVHVLRGSLMWDSSDYVTSGLLSLVSFYRSHRQYSELMSTWACPPGKV